MNAYERKIVSSFMSIEYGPAATVDQLAIAYGYFKTIANTLETEGYEIPRDLKTVVDSCKRDLDYKLRDSRLKELRALELKRNELLSNEEKIRNIDAKIESLKELTK